MFGKSKKYKAIYKALEKAKKEISQMSYEDIEKRKEGKFENWKIDIDAKIDKMRDRR